MTDITKGNFEEVVLKAEGSVLAEFWAPWCGYCRRLAPVFDRLAGEYGDRVRFVRVNIDENDALAERYGVDTIPTLILFRKGEQAASVVNPGSQSAIVKWLGENGALEETEHVKG